MVAIISPRVDEDPELAVRPLRREELHLLVRWLSMPHVDAWWHEPLDADGVLAKYGPRIDGREPVHMLLIEHGGRPIGWMQWYRWRDYAQHAGRLGAEPEAAGLDLAIGEPDLLGRGLGPRAIRELLGRIVFADPAITACVSDPEERNTRSVRAFEKAGFAAVGAVELPGESARRVVVRRERPR